MYKKIVLVVAFIMMLGFLYYSSTSVYATTNEPLYTQVDSSGNALDGNLDPVVQDKPVIRPSYVGANPYDDYLGTTGKFKKDPANPGFSLTQPINNRSSLVFKQMGFYQNRPIALFIFFPSYIPFGLRIRDDGSTSINYSSSGYIIRLVYDDGQVNNQTAETYTKDSVKYEVVKDVLLELPIVVKVSKNDERSSIFATRFLGLKRFTLISDYGRSSINKAGNVTIDLYKFKNEKGLYENLKALQVTFNNYFEERQPENIVLIQDNNFPLNIAYTQGRSITELDVNLFATNLPAYRELTYMPPKSLGTKNTNKFEAIFSVTQALGISFSKFYPDSLTIVMDDTKDNLFKKIDIRQLSFQDKDGTDITQYMTINQINDHKVEFTILKEQLELLKNNQINIKINSSGLNSESLLTHYNEEKNVYEIPINFYNYTMNGKKKTASDKMTAIAEITPSIYGEPVLGIEASQYTRSSDLDVSALVKDVATTLPADKLSVSFVDEDKDLYFDTVKTYNIRVAIRSITTGGEKIVTVPIKVNQAIPVTSAYFENQAWLISEINRQLAPKKIDGNPSNPANTVFMSDLSKIKIIDLNFILGNQKIPTTIKALNKLEQLRLTNSVGIGGELPKELGELSQLTRLELIQTGLTGKLPKELSQLTQLSNVNLSKTNFIGEVPAFPDQLKKLTVNDTQLTYNSKALPAFIKNGQAITTNSFVYNPTQSYLQLVGETVKIYDDKLTTIRPFSSSDKEMFKLSAVRSQKGVPIDPTEQGIALTQGHTYTILDGKTNKVYYSGKKDTTIRIPYYKDITYKVILDEAANNPNNVAMIQTKIQKQKVNVSFVDETGEALHAPLLFEGIIGTTIDFTKEPQVQKVLKELTEKNYLIKQRPESENAVKIKETESSVQYQLEGSLFVYSHPKLLSFGRQTLLKGLRFIKVEKATFDEPLVIWDNRKKSNSWQVTATLEKPLTSLTDPAQTIPEAIRYKKNEADSVIFTEGNAEVLATKTSNGTNKYNLSDEWKTGKSGFQLEVPTGKVVEPGGYRATILWQVGDTP